MTYPVSSIGGHNFCEKASGELFVRIFNNVLGVEADKEKSCVGGGML